MRVTLGAAIVALTLVPVAAGDRIYHSQHIALTPVGSAPLRSGFVENIHPNGLVVFAHEEYVLNGALPETTYAVTLHVSGAADTTCSAPFFEPTTATFATNAAGNGTAFAVFSPAAVDGLHNSTVNGYWTVSTGGGVAYATTCQTIDLD